jgi:hypothetical protein
MKVVTRLLLLVPLAAVLAMAVVAGAAEKATDTSAKTDAAAKATPTDTAARIKCLIITGQMRWHDIKNTTPLIKTQFEATGRFTVDVAETPPTGAPKDAWEKFKPEFSKYGVVFINYEGEMWPADIQKSFEKYMADGGGLVIYHFAIATFPDWEAWNKMLGMMWHPDPKSGAGLAVDADGKLIHHAKGEASGSHHGQPYVAPLATFDKEHPITRGLPAKWSHTKDEMYIGLRGPAENVTVLVSAFSPKDNNGTGLNEPIAWGVLYGKGRTFCTVLGHGVAETKVPDTMLLLERGAEWAATGAVTIPVPADFPKVDAGS